MTDNIYSWVKEQETNFSQEIEVMPNWMFCFKDHIQTSLMMKHGKFTKITNDLATKLPKKNIVLPLLNLKYYAEDIDVKDVELYVNDADKYHLSFLVKKYHEEVYAPEHHLDALFDEIKEEKIDLGGALVRKTNEGPMIEPLESIAFCDQTDILSGPIGFKLFFSPDELLDMASQGWGDKKKGATVTLEELITLADESKTQDSQGGRKTDTPGKYIEVYRIHGSMPTEYLTDKPNLTDEDKYTRQLQIIGFYKDKSGKAKGVTLYKAKEYESPFKFHQRGKKIRNRALSFGGVEEIFDAQMWTDFAEIHKKNFLDSASKTGLYTTDEAYANRNKIRDMENLEITVVKEGSDIRQIPTAPINARLFDQYVNEWDQYSQRVSGATDALLGENPASGTPFRLENLVTQRGLGLHENPKKKYARFISEIYEDWIIPDIAKELKKGTKFLATLSEDEMEYVAQCVVRNETNKFVKEKILSGELVYPDEIDAYKETVKEQFAQQGNKRFIEILKDELSEVPLGVHVNVAGKNKDLVGIVDKLGRIYQQIFATFNPQTQTFAALDDPRMLKRLQKMEELAGLDPIDLGSTYVKPKPPMQQMPQMPQQMQQQMPQPQPVA